MTLSALRKRYFLPNIAVTEQKVQSKGQPQLVMIGIVVQLVAADEQAQVRERQFVEVGERLARRVVHGDPVALERQAGDAVQLAVAGQRLDELEHELLAALAAGHVVHVLQRLVGHEGDVRPADDDRDAAPVQVLGEPVGGRAPWRSCSRDRRGPTSSRRPSRWAPWWGCRRARRGRAP